MSEPQWDDLTLDDLVAELDRRTGDDGGAMQMLTAVDVMLAGVPTADLAAEIVRRLAALTAPAPLAANGDGGPQLLTAEAVGAILGKPKAGVYEMARRGQIGSVRDGRLVKFTKAQVAAFISSRSRPVT
jgi:excisionase family DNA binding protein